MKGRTGLKSMENGVECEKNGEIDNGRERDLVQNSLVSEERWKI